ncbi:NAD(P)/FAD-dependent oxidoreductase [Deinococcus radiophilus]|uniref:NAD(P)/FAD-dependent oxidoreductase n=1 Tax=Deinococcus radiophilus TaxID=32062 RepID=UPI001E6477AD|nr:FAD-binding oxidoreductase [Deinococcus radiophilus]UFA51543.1 FAD-binding oxidoreductase [Deinococcus radiophilus]
MTVQFSDVIVIGGGIIGAACAFRLSEAGLRVTVLDRGAAPGRGSSGRSGAGVRVQFSEEVNVRLSWESIQEYQRFPELYGRESGYVQNGYLFLVPEAAWEAHEQGVAVQRAVGAPVEVVTPQEGARYVPYLLGGIYRCTYGPQDGYIDPLLTLNAYTDMALGRGAELHRQAEVTHIEAVGEGWTVYSSQGDFSAPLIVNASGAWSGAVAALAGLDVPVRPRRRSVYRTKTGNGQPSYPLTVDVASNLWLRGHNDTVIFTVSNPYQPDGLEEGIDWPWLTHVREVARDRFPWLAELEVDRSYSFWGYYEMTPDGSPILGRMAEAPGWINACGFSGHGVQQAAAVGRIVAAFAQDQEPFIDVSSLRLERFGQGAATAERHIV